MPNRLIHEDSPYLQQHAHNPVDWWPWCDEAFKRAERENKPIFLSVGYASCHWCHVMEREVFEDNKIADYLNAHFISIKVDREERPDIDKHYQSVHQLLNQRPGGWPLSIFMTPDRKPFFAATYIPPERKYNMMGFLELIEMIHEKWSRSPGEIVKNADEIQRFLKPKEGPLKATKLELSIAQKFVEQAADSYDAEWGGFLKAPKFPHTSTLNLLMDLSRLLENKKARDMALHTMRVMARGGLYDIIDGGFCRYSTDDAWLVPHFEKMTYDNGLLCESYLKAYRLTKDPFFLTIAQEVIAFMLEKMSEGDLFYTASDADTEGKEGKYFLFDYDEVIKELTSRGYAGEEAAKICRALSITPEGNFEGRNIVRFTSDERPEWWPKVKKILRFLRASRTYPFIDRKIITAWNAMMIKALFLAAEIDERHLKQAIKSLNALLGLMEKEDALYHSALAGKEPAVEGFLEDYAYLGDALLQAYRTTLDEIWLLKARRLADTAVERFYRGDKWYFSRGEFETEAEIADTSYPASMAVMTRVLLNLSALLNEESYRDVAFKTLEFHSYKLMRYPLYHPTLTEAAVRFLTEDIVVKSLPDRLAEAKPIFDEAPYPWVQLKSENRPLYMVCNRHSCFAAAKSLKELAEALRKIG